jgi:hypothetical protein
MIAGISGRTLAEENKMLNPILTDEMIDHLIGARERMTNVTADYPDRQAIGHIDAVLRAISVGQRPDVDALLGRSVKEVQQTTD